MLHSQHKSGTFQAIKSVFMDCFTNSTGHGLPQIVKPGNIFLSVLWAVFFLVAIVGGSFLIYQAVDQFTRYEVITMTKIKRESEITFPALTFCSYRSHTLNIRDMITYCAYGDKGYKNCKMTNLTIYDKYGDPHNCVKSESVNLNREGYQNGFSFFLYHPPDSDIQFAVTENTARLVLEEVREIVHTGQETFIVLSKTNQTALGPPYSQCNETTDYRQVNCMEDCFNKAMTEICGCVFPVECGHYSDWTKECKRADYYNSSLIQLKCNKLCPVECNKVNFAINRVDIELKIKCLEVEYHKS